MGPPARPVRGGPATSDSSEPSATPDGWSPKDVMFHVGAWLAECAKVLEQIREGTFDRAAEDARTAFTR